jgi:hypothetical protein
MHDTASRPTGATGWHVSAGPGRYPQVEDADGRLVALVIGHPIWMPSETAAHAAQLAAAPDLVYLLDCLVYAVQERKYWEAAGAADQAAVLLAQLREAGQ